jgi:hypothetical protein|eukprot:SAG25_NODE_46_length_19040_cov_20.665699_18_plen_402_part_00
MMTLEDGGRQFGFCRTIIQPDGYMTLCVMTRYPWFSLFTPLLEALEMRAGRGVDALESILDSACTSCRDHFPTPGESFRVTLEAGGSGEGGQHAAAAGEGGGVGSARGVGDGGAAALTLTRPKDDSTPLADATPDFYMLFKALSVPAIMAVFRALLSECRILFISEDLVRLSSCMYSIASLIFPFSWHNIFIPICPEMYLDYLTAPMPFVIGVHTSLMPRVERIPGIEEEVVMVNLDTNEVSLDMSTLIELPSDPEQKLVKGLSQWYSQITSMKAKIRKRTSAAQFNAAVSDASPLSSQRSNVPLGRAKRDEMRRVGDCRSKRSSTISWSPSSVSTGASWTRTTSTRSIPRSSRRPAAATPPGTPTSCSISASRRCSRRGASSVPSWLCGGSPPTTPSSRR